MDNRYGSLLVQMILVLLTMDSRVRLILWEFWVCFFGPPLLWCMLASEKEWLRIAYVCLVMEFTVSNMARKLVNEVGLFDVVGWWG